MSRAFSVLLALVIVLSMMVIYVRHQHRVVFAEIQRIERHYAELSSEEERLLLEQQSSMRFGRLELAAKKKLGMVKPDPDDVQIIKLRSQ